MFLLVAAWAGEAPPDVVSALLLMRGAPDTLAARDKEGETPEAVERYYSNWRHAEMLDPSRIETFRAMRGAVVRRATSGECAPRPFCPRPRARKFVRLRSDRGTQS